VLVLVRLAGCGNRRSGGHRIRSRFARPAVRSKFTGIVGLAKFALAVEPPGTVREIDLVVQVAPGAGRRPSVVFPWSIECVTLVRSTGPIFPAEQRFESAAFGLGRPQRARWKFRQPGAGDSAPGERTFKFAQFRLARIPIAAGKLEFRLALGRSQAFSRPRGAQQG